MTTYNVYRDGVKIKGDITEKRYTDSDVVPGKTYEYAVSSQIGDVESELSADVVVTIPEEGEPVHGPVAEVVSVEVSPKTNNLSELNVRRQLTATVLPEDANQTVVWSSDNPKICDIDPDGLLRSMGPGTTTIRATAVNGVEGTATVNVAG